MNGEVVTLRHTVEHHRAESLEAMLEDILERVREGEYKDLVCVLRRRKPFNHLAVWSSAHDHVINIIGSLEIAKMELIDQSMDILTEDMFEDDEFSDD